MEFASLYYFFLTIHNKVRNISQLLCIRKCRRTPLELNEHLCSLKLAAELQFFFEVVSLTVWEVNKTFYNPSIWKLLHLILTQAFKKSKLMSKRQKYRACPGKTRNNFKFSDNLSFTSNNILIPGASRLSKIQPFWKPRGPWERNCVQRRFSTESLYAYRWTDCRDVERHFLLSS